MKKNIWYIAWFVLYLATVILGSVEPGSAGMKGLMIVLAVGFFVPPVVLMVQALKIGDRKTVLLLRLVSAISLGCTFAFMLLNFLSLGMSQTVGDFLYAVLVVVSAPMMCSQYWAVSMFVWACLLMTSLMYCPKEKKKPGKK